MVTPVKTNLEVLLLLLLLLMQMQATKLQENTRKTKRRKRRRNIKKISRRRIKNLRKRKNTRRTRRKKREKNHHHLIPPTLTLLRGTLTLAKCASTLDLGKKSRWRSIKTQQMLLWSSVAQKWGHFSIHSSEAMSQSGVYFLLSSPTARAGCTFVGIKWRHVSCDPSNKVAGIELPILFAVPHIVALLTCRPLCIQINKKLQLNQDPAL